MQALPPDLLLFIVDGVNVGIFTLNHKNEIVQWNKFMEIHSGRKAADVIGRNLFTCFPELPENWLSKKIKSVFLLKNFAFTSWQQRPYLFKFRSTRSLTVETDAMQQDCTFLPVKDRNGAVEFVCITLFDVTETSIYQTDLKKINIELEKTKNILQQMSVTDALTGVFNRGHLESRLQQEFERTGRYGGKLSLILFDIDHFKKINDTYGHPGGDEVLRRISALTQSLTRTSDIFGRYGGEEFAILVPGVDQQGAYMLAERVRQHVADEKFMFRSHTIPVTISLGVAEMTKDLQRYEELVQNADKALYQAKQGGRNRTTLFDLQRACV